MPFRINEMDEVKEHQKRLNKEQAWLQISKWCAFQERSQQEARDKLYNYGLHREEVEQTIARLVSENFINEERFAIAFAGGKFRQLGWGKIKIRLALKQKQVSDYCLRSALASINDEDYSAKLREILRKREREEKEKHPIKRRQRIARYLMSRGFEGDIVWSLLGEDPG
jgi:regulatory protein